MLSKEREIYCIEKPQDWPVTIRIWRESEGGQGRAFETPMKKSKGERGSKFKSWEARERGMAKRGRGRTQWIASKDIVYNSTDILIFYTWSSELNKLNAKWYHITN